MTTRHRLVALALIAAGAFAPLAAIDASGADPSTAPRATAAGGAVVSPFSGEPFCC